MGKEKFPELSLLGGSDEKFWSRIPHRVHPYSLGRWRRGVHRASPAAAGAPDLSTAVQRQILLQPLSDAAQLYIAMIGLKFTAPLAAVVVGVAMQVRIATAPGQWAHSLHPEVIGIRAQRVEGLFEGNFDADLRLRPI